MVRDGSPEHDGLGTVIIKIPLVLLEVLQTTFGGGPMIVRLGNASGDSALRSRTTSPNGVINAQASSMYEPDRRHGRCWSRRDGAESVVSGY